MDCSPPGPSVHGILQAEILEWLAFPPPGDLLHLGIEPMSLMSHALAGGFFTMSATRKALKANSLFELKFSLFFGEGNGNPLQYSCLENPMDRGAWWAAAHGVTKSRTRLSDFTFTHFS